MVLHFTVIDLVIINLFYFIFYTRENSSGKIIFPEIMKFHSGYYYCSIKGDCSVIMSCMVE